MARRYETITELYHETIAGLAAPQVWQSFLTAACHNFRLPFDERYFYSRSVRTQPPSCRLTEKTAGISVSGVGSTVEQQALPSLTGMQWDAPG